MALLASLVVACAAPVLHAQAVALVDSATNYSTSNALASSLTFTDFSLGAGNALVVVISSEAVGTNAFSVTFGGSAVTANVANAQGAQSSAVYWIINPSVTTGDVVVDLGADSRAGVSVLSLSNVGGVSDSDTFTASNNTTSFPISYDATAGGFVVAGYVDNGSNTGGSASISGGNINTTLLSLTNDQDGSSAGIVQGYGSISATALATETFTSSRNTSSNNRHAAALVAFSAIPEPSTFAALAGLAGLGLAVARRRRS